MSNPYANTNNQEEEYDPASPSLKPKVEEPQRAPRSPNPNQKQPASPRYNPTSPTYRPQSPERTGSAARARSPPTAHEQNSFAFVGDAFQPTNLVDIPRPVITKWLKCTICPDPIKLSTFVPAFLCRRPTESCVPNDMKDAPWFWTQAYCFGCRYTFTVKIYLPRELFSCCTLARYPPPKSKDNRHGNGLPQGATATDGTVNEMVQQRRRDAPRDRRRTPPRDRRQRSPPRRMRSRSRSPYTKEYGHSVYSRSPPRRRRSPNRHMDQQVRGYGHSYVPDQYNQQQYYQQQVVPPPQQYYEYIPPPNSSVPPVKTETYGAYQNRMQ